MRWLSLFIRNLSEKFGSRMVLNICENWSNSTRTGVDFRVHNYVDLNVNIWPCMTWLAGPGFSKLVLSALACYIFCSIEISVWYSYIEGHFRVGSLPAIMCVSNRTGSIDFGQVSWCDRSDASFWVQNGFSLGCPIISTIADMPWRSTTLLEWIRIAFEHMAYVIVRNVLMCCMDPDTIQAKWICFLCEALLH